jgi:hypothetical protein
VDEGSPDGETKMPKSTDEVAHRVRVNDGSAVSSFKFRSCDSNGDFFSVAQ